MSDEAHGAAGAAPGNIIKGKYRIDRILGEGGMGVVVAAHHVGLDQRVAIKFLHRQMLAHGDVVTRFAREARAATKIESDHIARVLDVDALEDGTPFMVMEYLEGNDLSKVRKEQRPLPVHIAAQYLLEACEAIGEAHRLGIVHRDIKPANLFLARRADGRVRVKVLDFGISKMGAGSEPSVTKTSAVMGSAEYMSPEQMMASRDVDARTDIWALGVTLYELVTAQVPFPGETITHVCALVISSQPLPPSAHRPDLPAGFDQLVAKCLEKDRTNRFGSIAELATALAPYARPMATGSDRPSGERWSQPTPAPLGGGTMSLAASAAAASRSSSGTISSPGMVTEMPPTATPAINVLASHAGSTTGVVSSDLSPPTHSRSPLVAIAIGAVVAIGAGAWFFLHHGSAETSAAASASATGVLVEPSVAPSSSATPTAVPVVEVATALPSSAASSASPSATAKADTGSHHAKAAAAPPAHAPTVAPAAAKPNCNPPYTFDAQGDKHAKPECF